MDNDKSVRRKHLFRLQHALVPLVSAIDEDDVKYPPGKRIIPIGIDNFGNVFSLRTVPEY